MVLCLPILQLPSPYSAKRLKPLHRRLFQLYGKISMGHRALTNLPSRLSRCQMSLSTHTVLLSCSMKEKIRLYLFIQLSVSTMFSGHSTCTNQKDVHCVVSTTFIPVFVSSFEHELLAKYIKCKNNDIPYSAAPNSPRCHELWAERQIGIET